MTSPTVTPSNQVTNPYKEEKKVVDILDDEKLDSILEGSKIDFKVSLDDNEIKALNDLFL